MARRDAGQLARCAPHARQAIVAAIKVGFDPAFSSKDVAAALGFSRRYVNGLLYQTGTTFA